MRTNPISGLTILIGPVVLGAVVLGLIVARPVRGHAADFFPFDEDVARLYSTLGPPPDAGEFSTRFEGRVFIEAYDIHVLNHVGGASDGLRQFWSKCGNGNLLFHGYELDDFTLVWTPPLLMMAFPLSVGKKWISESVDPFDSSPVVLEFEIVAMGNVTVPAGTFNAVTIRFSEPVPTKAGQRARASIMGFPGSGANPDEIIYGDSAGILEWNSINSTDTLMAIGPVAVEATTWSEIRELYR